MRHPHLSVSLCTAGKGGREGGRRLLCLLDIVWKIPSAALPNCWRNSSESPTNPLEGCALSRNRQGAFWLPRPTTHTGKPQCFSPSEDVAPLPRAEPCMEFLVRQQGFTAGERWYFSNNAINQICEQQQASVPAVQQP